MRRDAAAGKADAMPASDDKAGEARAAKPGAENGALAKQQALQAGQAGAGEASPVRGPI